MTICQTIFYTLALLLPIFEMNTNWGTEFIYTSFTGASLFKFDFVRSKSSKFPALPLRILSFIFIYFPSHAFDFSHIFSSKYIIGAFGVVLNRLLDHSTHNSRYLEVTSARDATHT